MEGQKSSGIWVSTATGSTAAINAAGGVTMPIDSRHLQYCVREIMRSGAPKYSLVGGVYDPDLLQLAIENRNENGMLALDGQHGVIELALGDWIHINRGPDLKIVREL
jgi:NAD+ kinase